MIMDRGLADYIQNSYGRCRKGKDCLCLRHMAVMGWHGKACPEWEPTKARDWEELMREVSNDPER